MSDPELDDDDEDLPIEDDDEGEDNETGEACPAGKGDGAENDPLRTSDPYGLCRRLADKLRELRDRREAQDLVDEGEKLLADLKRDPAERRTQMEAASRAKAEARAAARTARGTPRGAKSAMRSIGRLLARCENAFDDLIGEGEPSSDITTRIHLASAAARLANAASALGNSISSNGRTRALLKRTRNAAKPRKPKDEAPMETS
ncbi:MAG TPA: hypothetical protein VEH07_03085 [Alphaproteobacteria bacterium]|nr:hypothetical protein [Alphaproteobacteria bacterium]